MAGHAKPIYVEIEIRASIERVWDMTQTPESHQRWDLRFSEIRYLPRASADEAQRFAYATRIGLGMEVRGEGETVGARDGPGGERSSALKFWSAERRSLIRAGSGYWRYVPHDDGGERVRFLTGYDYEVRFGVLGRAIDRWAFRPLMGWATAWSFDRLRLWIERGIDPAASMRRSVTHAIARVALALIWIYQGLGPKVMARHADELAMLRDLGVSGGAANGAALAIGGAEVAVGAVMLFAWRARWPAWMTLAAMPLALVAVAIGSPGFLMAAFNPVSLNLGVFALAAIALIEGRDLPSARRCLRRPREGRP
jgi:hypothetical protein